MATKKRTKKKSMALGGGGRFAALAAKIGPAAAAAAGVRKYGKSGMKALQTKGTAGAPEARASAKRIAAKKKKKA